MKKLIDNYTFTASAKTITFNDYEEIIHSGVLLITNVTDGIIIYNFASPLLSGVVANNILTLTYSTVAMSDTDSLQIWYDDGITASNVKEDDELSLVIRLLLMKAVESPVWYDIATNALRITGTVAISAGTITTVTGVTTVSTLTDQTRWGGYSADQVTINLSEIDWGITIRGLLT